MHDAVLEQAAQGLLLVDGDRMMLANPRAQGLLGLPPEELLATPATGRTWRQRVRDGLLDRCRSTAPGLSDLTCLRNWWRSCRRVNRFGRSG